MLLFFKEKAEKKGNKAMMDPCKKVYLPTWMLDIYDQIVGKYTLLIDPLGSFFSAENHQGRHAGWSREHLWGIRNVTGFGCFFLGFLDDVQPKVCA